MGKSVCFKKWLLSVAMLFIGIGMVSAQEIKLSGVVTAKEDGLPMPGVSVFVKGTTNGTITDFDGNYHLTATQGSVVVFSFIGMTTQEVVVGNTTSINVVLQNDATDLEEVVVTALGIKREKKALGYAAAEVGSEAFSNAKDANPMGALSGRLAGVQINSTAQGAGGSSSVLIRGAAVLSGSNEPLYVVDGIPISNTQFSNADDSDNGGVDSGNGISAIPADDIENISVLKGPAATALYGSRAINGVVLITTKRGSKDKGTTVDFNSNMTFEKARILSDWQQVYGQGFDGKAPSTLTEGKEQTSMWGARYSDVSDYVNYRGDVRDYRYHDNEKDFFESGFTWTNSVALNHQTESANVRLSYSNTTNDGMIPNTTYDRNALTVAGGAKAFKDRVELDAKLSYTDENSDNVMMGSTPFNPTSQLLGIPNNIALADLKNYKNPVTGLPVGLGNLDSNPYWTLNEIEQGFVKKRLMSLVSAKIKISDHLSVQGRYGSDLTFYNSEALFPIGTPYYQSGRASMNKSQEIENNYDFLATYNRDFDTFGLTVNAGASRMDRELDGMQLFSASFAEPSLQRPGAGIENSTSLIYSRKRINSVYGTAQMRYKGMVYLDLSARNDWSSTLPSSDNSYFYPSVSTSFILSEMMEMPSWVTFSKLRGSWAQVGSDTDPYRLVLQYKLDDYTHPNHGGGNTIIGGVDGSTIPNAYLKPSIMSSYEFGGEFKFLKNRLGLDVTYYNSEAKDQIIPVTVSNSSGFEKALINSGSIVNKGWEVSLTATPLQRKDFTWNTALNFAKNSNEVASLADGVSQLELIKGGGAQVIAGVGMEYGTIMGKKLQRDENGQIKLDGNGLPMVTDQYFAIGNGYHDVMLGWVNSLNYKNFTLNLVVDSKFGGDIYSSTEASAYSLGKHKNTLERSEYVAGKAWAPSELEGLTTTAKPSELYGRLSSAHELFMYNASYISLKEMSLSYTVPSKFFGENSYFRAASVGVFGKNLCYLYKGTDNIDPQAAYSISNGASGLEIGNMSMPSSFGVNLNLKF